jgi:hypothetical protein
MDTFLEMGICFSTEQKKSQHKQKLEQEGFPYDYQQSELLYNVYDKRKDAEYERQKPHTRSYFNTTSRVPISLYS